MPSIILIRLTKSYWLPVLLLPMSLQVVCIVPQLLVSFLALVKVWSMLLPTHLLPPPQSFLICLVAPR